MFSWTTQQPTKTVTKRTIGFTDMKHAVQHGYVILNTLAETQQGCLITGSLVATEEESIINDFLEHEETDKIIVVYGAHSCDDSVDKKVDELYEVGFRRVYVYVGGIFEWLMLQDIFGVNEFQTTTRCTDLLVFQPTRRKF